MLTQPARFMFLRLLMAFVALTFILVACGGGGGNEDVDSNPIPLRSTWTWVSGSNTNDQAGVYDSTTNLPGARSGGVSWTDSQNSLWLFGGYGYSNNTQVIGYLNDLWKFESNTWTWVSGSDVNNQPGDYDNLNTTAIVPGARSYASKWIDSSHNLWLFGGDGYDSAGTSGYLNDLWKFDPVTANWTWMSGSKLVGQLGQYTVTEGKVPGARSAAVSWTDGSNNLWLFGGWGYASAETPGILNDLWKFDGVNWTWVSGSMLVGQLGRYAATEGNVPGARYSAVSWTDSSHNLWLFGGYGYDSVGDLGYLNDLWKFDPVNANWAWMSGSNTINQSGHYGNIGVSAADNMPGGRLKPVAWIDSGNRLWLFGGYGHGATGNAEILNDLWVFNGVNWTWVSGSNSIKEPGNYGVQGVPAMTNVPGARYNGISWIDSSNRLWLFGGMGIDKGNEDNLRYNDLWRFQPAAQ